jgi:prepilin-type processing-associated H-X9-DG protein
MVRDYWLIGPQQFRANPNRASCKPIVNNALQLIQAQSGTRRPRFCSFHRRRWASSTRFTKVIPWRIQLILGHQGINNRPCPPNSLVAHVDGFWCRHPGGANFLLGDGSVRQVNNTINPRAWVAMGTLSGGEVVSMD